MIIRKAGMYYGVSFEGRLYPIVAWRFYANSGCVFAEPNEAYDYFVDPFLEHYLLQGDEGIVKDGELV